MNEDDKSAKLRAAMQKLGCEHCRNYNRPNTLDAKFFGPCSANAASTIISTAEQQGHCNDKSD